MDTIVEIMQYLEPFTAKTVFCKIDAIQDYFDIIGSQIGFGGDMVLYLFFMLLAYPMGFIMVRLPSVTIRHLFSLLFGVFMFQNTFGSQWIHALLAPAITYVLIIISPKKYMAISVFIFNMLYISFAHIYRTYTDYMGYSLDFTGPQMILVIKLTSFGYNCYDGMVDWEFLNKPAKDTREQKILNKRKSLAIRELPSLLEFFSYTFNFSTSFAGPAFEYTLFQRGMLQKDFKDAKLPSGNFSAGISTLMIAIISMGIHVVIGGMYPVTPYYDKELNVDFMENSLWYRVMYCWIAEFCARCKYYFAWKFAEGACILSGFGFEGYDEKGEVKGWSASSNIDIIGMEVASNVSECSKAWNQKTQTWLQNYVYSRTNGSIIAVYSISAFWHGFYPGYYFFFFHTAFIQSINRMANKKVTSRFKGTSMEKYYNILCTILFSLYINYFSVSFVVLGFDRGLATWKTLGYLGHYVSVGAYLVFTLLPSPPKAVEKDSKKTK